MSKLTDIIASSRTLAITAVARVRLRPVRRVVVWLQVTALTDGISRALR